MALFGRGRSGGAGGGTGAGSGGGTGHGTGGATDGEPARARRGSRGGRGGRAARAHGAELEHLEAFAQARRGVEGFVEPETAQTPTTLVLVAGDGEWTRRRVGTPEVAFAFGRRVGLPVYDVAAVGYPARMREWTSRNPGRGPAQA